MRIFQSAFFILCYNCGTKKHGRAIFIFKELQTNGQIRDREVRLINQNGEQLGVVSIYDAMSRAEAVQMDLVKISPTAVPPVCKIMDYGKFKYEQVKKEKEAKKNQKIVELKEMRLSMTIDDNDVNTKAKAVIKFLKEGDKVKVSIKMRGRQMVYAKSGIEVMHSFAGLVKEAGVIEKMPAADGRNIIMILAPIVQKPASNN